MAADVGHPGRRWPRPTRSWPRSWRRTSASRPSAPRSPRRRSAWSARACSTGAKHIPGSYDTPMRFAMLAFQQKNVVMAEADITRGTLEALARPPAGQRLPGAAAGAGRARGRRRRLPRGRLSAGAAARSGGRRRTGALLARLGVETARGRAGLLSPPPPRGLPLAAGGGALARRPAVLRRAHGSARRRSIAATSGTTFPSTPRASACRSRARATRRSPCSCAGRASATAAGALAHHHRRLALRAGRPTGRSTCATRTRTSARGSGGTWWPRRSGCRRLVAAGRDGEGEVGQRRHRSRSPTTTRSAPATCRPTAWWRASTSSPARRAAASATSTTASAPTARSTTPRCAGASPTAVTGWQNNLAVRLFSFVIRHRHQASRWARWRWTSAAASGRRGEVFDLRLPTRGFYFELDPPLPVETLPGHDQGQAGRSRSPATCASPGVVYARRAAPRRPRAGPRPRREGRARPPASHDRGRASRGAASVVSILASCCSGAQRGAALRRSPSGSAAAGHGRGCSTRRRRSPTRQRCPGPVAAGRSRWRPSRRSAIPRSARVRLKLFGAAGRGRGVLGAQAAGRRRTQAAGDRAPARQRAARPGGACAGFPAVPHAPVHRSRRHADRPPGHARQAPAARVEASEPAPRSTRRAAADRAVARLLLTMRAA